LAVITEDEYSGIKISNIEISKISSIRETGGISFTSLILVGDPDKPPLTVLRYTNRQQHAIENIKFIVEQKINGHHFSLLQPVVVVLSFLMLVFLGIHQNKINFQEDLSIN